MPLIPLLNSYCCPFPPRIYPIPFLRDLSKNLSNPSVTKVPIKWLFLSTSLYPCFCQGPPCQEKWIRIMPLASFTCCCSGKFSTALSSKWITSESSRTGMPAARPCLVKLRQHALAVSCTAKSKGWFLIPIITSWNIRECTAWTVLYLLFCQLVAMLLSMS